jgi:hypothetical protein
MIQVMSRQPYSIEDTLGLRCPPTFIRGFVCLVVITCVLALPGLAYETQHVCLVVIDGLRYSEGLGDPSHTYVPEMYALSQQGTIIEPFINDGITYTARAIPAIWCGAWTEVHSFSDPACGGRPNNYCELPTIFEYYRKLLSKPETDCIYVLGDVGCPWKASFSAGYGTAYWPLYHSEGGSDLYVWYEAESIVGALHPSFFLIYLSGVDHGGHSGSWDYYTSSIAVADSVVGMLWDWLQADPFYAGVTTMFVTNDHGRHTHDFSGHGDACDGCRTIQLLAVGPDIKQDFVSATPRSIPDITPSIGALLGFEAEHSTGQVMTEIFRDTGPHDSTDMGTCDLCLRAAPNPFTSVTRFRIDVTDAGPGSIRIHDVRGRLVAVPFEGPLAPGTQYIPWEPCDARGDELSPGIYFVTLEISERSTTRRVVLTR